MRRALLAVLFASVALACAAHYARPAAYETELLTCVEQADTIAESRACRADVMRRYGRLDGGADR